MFGSGDKQSKVSWSFLVLLAIVVAGFAFYPNPKGAVADLEISPCQFSDNDWDYISHYPDMCSLQAGNLGVGTNRPCAKLDVEGTFNVSDQFTSTLPTGTPPIEVESKTTCTNLNADMVDGYSAGALAKRRSLHIPPGGCSKTIEVPRYKPFQLIIAEAYGAPDEMAFVHIMENDNAIAWFGFD